jgi:hypothetical protein
VAANKWEISRILRHIIDSIFSIALNPLLLSIISTNRFEAGDTDSCVGSLRLSP